MRSTTVGARLAYKGRAALALRDDVISRMPGTAKSARN